MVKSKMQIFCFVLVLMCFGIYCSPPNPSTQENSSESPSDSSISSESPSDSSTSSESPSDSPTSSESSSDASNPSEGNESVLHDSSPEQAPLPCQPKCAFGASECISLTDNANASQFGLRISQVSFSKPKVITTGILKAIFEGGTQLNLPACQLAGDGTNNWLLRFKKTENQLEMGGAKAVNDPTLGYSFLNEKAENIQIQPTTFALTFDANGRFTSEYAESLVLPIYLSSTDLFVFVLRRAKIEGTLSASQGCIGRYNAAGLSPKDNCAPDENVSQFINGGKFSGYLSLEQADAISVGVLRRSLCVVLSGDAAMYGDRESPQKCKRGEQGEIVFKGDWCTQTDSPATGDCADAVRVEAEFAASGINIR